MIICLALLAGGCSGPVPEDGDKPSRPPRSHGTPAVHESWPSCVPFVPTDYGMLFGGGAEAVTLPRLDDDSDFRPVAAIICRSDSQPHPGGGSDLVAIEERAAGIDALLAALRLPDQDIEECHGEFWAQYVPWVALQDAQGRWIRPGIPVAPCNAARAEVRTAISDLAVVRISTHVLRRNDKDIAKAGGCHDSEQYYQPFTAEHDPPPASSPAPPTLRASSLPAPTADVRVCRFLNHPTVDPGDGRTYYLGTLQDGNQLSPDAWAAVRRELIEAAPAEPCSRSSERFAVLREKSWDPPISVEADGCHRVLIEGGEPGRGDLRQGSADLVALLYNR